MSVGDGVQLRGGPFICGMASAERRAFEPLERFILDLPCLASIVLRQPVRLLQLRKRQPLLPVSREGHVQRERSAAVSSGQEDRDPALGQVALKRHQSPKCRTPPLGTASDDSCKFNGLWQGGQK